MRLLIMPGDGIGPEIMAATVTALGALNKRFDLKLDFTECTIGLPALADAQASPLPIPKLELSPKGTAMQGTNTRNRGSQSWTLIDR